MKKLSVLCLVAVSAFAQKAADHKFIVEAGQGGMAEVTLGKLAEQKGSNQVVKNFGAQMVKDHSKANDELKSIASSKNVTVPDSLTAKDKALYEMLSAMSGDQFDRTYIKAMVKDHQTDVSEFRKESQNGRDSDVKNFASKTLPTLEHHLQMAQDAEAKLGSSTSAATR
jgi:putative membrane protein